MTERERDEGLLLSKQAILRKLEEIAHYLGALSCKDLYHTLTGTVFTINSSMLYILYT